MAKLTDKDYGVLLPEEMEQEQEELPKDPSILDAPDSEDEGLLASTATGTGGKQLAAARYASASASAAAPAAASAAATASASRKRQKESSLPPVFYSYSRTSRINSELSRALTGTHLNALNDEVFDGLGGRHSPATGSVGYPGYNEIFSQGTSRAASESFPPS